MNLDDLKSKLADKPEQESPMLYTEDQLMARLRFFIGICLALTLTGIVFVVLYSIIFVTQPLNAISPIDQKFFELIIPIATFLTGTLSGIMLAGKDDKETKMRALEAATRPVTPSPNLPGASQPFPSRSFTPTHTAAPAPQVSVGVPSAGPVMPPPPVQRTSPPPPGMPPPPPVLNGAPPPPNIPGV